jgi:putative phosphoribosyl transferase
MKAFRDRRDAGRRLAQDLQAYRADPDVVVLALPRGGVPVGYEVALALDAPLDVVVARKLGHPFSPELAIGAVAEGGVRVLNRDILLPPGTVAAIAAHERRELQRRVHLYRKGGAGIDPRGRTVILVDDGLATGSTMRAAIASVRKRAARKVVVAIPVAPRTACDELFIECDALVCPLQPPDMLAVGEWYEEFAQVSHEDVVSLLEAARRESVAL